MTGQDFVTIPIQGIIAATADAVLVETLDYNQHWIPRSAIPEKTSNEIPIATYTVMEEIQIARWLTEKKGLF